MKIRRITIILLSFFIIFIEGMYSQKNDLYLSLGASSAAFFIMIIDISKNIEEKKIILIPILVTIFLILNLFFCYIL